jgi:hypothetical protein
VNKISLIALSLVRLSCSGVCGASYQQMSLHFNQPDNENDNMISSSDSSRVTQYVIHWFLLVIATQVSLVISTG